MQLFLGCTDALTADFVSQRTGEVSINVTSTAKQLGTWRISNYTPEYRETSGVGRRRLLTMDEVLRLDIDKALVIVRGQKIMEVDKYDYSKHPEAKKLRDSKASAHVPEWRRAAAAKASAPAPSPQAKPVRKHHRKPTAQAPADAGAVKPVTKDSIMSKPKGKKEE